MSILRETIRFFKRHPRFAILHFGNPNLCLSSPKPLAWFKQDLKDRCNKKKS
jgi:hypothetical protein